MKNYIYIFIIISTMAQMGCYDDVEKPKTTVIVKDVPQVIIDHNLIGQIKTQSGEALSNVVVSYGDQSFPTNNENFFHTSAKKVNKYHQPLNLSYQGLTLHYPYPMIENTTNYATYITPDVLANGTINPSNPNNLVLSPSLTLQFKADAFTQQSSRVTAPIDIIYSQYNYIPNGHYPGGNVLQDNAGEFKLLVPEQFFILQMDQSIRFDASFINTPVDQLYRYNEVYHIWQLANFAAFDNSIDQGGLYALGSHKDYVEVGGQVLSNDTPLNGGTISIEGQLSYTISSTIDGQFIGYAPINSEINLTLNEDCSVINQNVVIESNPNKSINVDFELEVINSYVIRGEIKDCENNNIESSILKIALSETSDPIIKVIDKKDFEIAIVTCETINTIELESQLINGEQKSQNLIFGTKDTIDVFHVFICNELDDEFLTMEIDDHFTVLEMGQSIEKDGILNIKFSDPNEDILINLISQSMRQETYQDEDLNIVISAPTLEGIGYELQCNSSPTGCGFEQFSYTEFGDQKGEFIRGYYKGRFWVKTFEPIVSAGYKNIEGVFHIRRNF